MDSVSIQNKNKYKNSRTKIRDINFKHYLALLFSFVHANIKNNHRDKLLGLVWTLLDPLLMMLVYLFLVKVVFNHRIENFPIYLYTGLIAWRYFSLSCQAASVCFRKNRNLLLSANFPRILIPLSIVLSSGYDFIFSSLVLVFLYIILRVPITELVLFVPFVFILQTLFNLGWALLFSIAGIRYTDISNILIFVMRLGWYLSPGIYAISQIPEKYIKIYMLNPMADFLEIYRALTMYGKCPPMQYIGYTMIVSLLVCLIGIVFFIKNERKVTKYI